MPRHSLLVEVDEDVWEALQVQAKANMRSTRKEMEFILRQAVVDGLYWPKVPTPEQEQSAPPRVEDIL